MVVDSLVPRPERRAGRVSCKHTYTDSERERERGEKTGSIVEI